MVGEVGQGEVDRQLNLSFESELFQLWKHSQPEVGVELELIVNFGFEFGSVY